MKSKRLLIFVAALLAGLAAGAATASPPPGPADPAHARGPGRH
jgi:hypothetical protein